MEILQPFASAELVLPGSEAAQMNVQGSYSTSGR